MPNIDRKGISVDDAVRFNLQFDEGRFRMCLATGTGGYRILVTGRRKRTFVDDEAAFDAVMEYVRQFPSMPRVQVEDIYLRAHKELRNAVQEQGTSRSMFCKEGSR